MARIRERDAASIAPLSEKDAQMARTAQRLLIESLDRSRAATITLEAEDGSHPAVEIPPATLRLIATVLGMLSEGKDVVLQRRNREMTTVQAANYLGVSRQFVVNEIQAGRLVCKMVGTHRRIALDELRRYDAQMRQSQEEALKRMADNAAELGLDY